MRVRHDLRAPVPNSRQVFVERGLVPDASSACGGGADGNGACCSSDQRLKDSSKALSPISPATSLDLGSRTLVSGRTSANNRHRSCRLNNSIGGFAVQGVLDLARASCVIPMLRASRRPGGRLQRGSAEGCSTSQPVPPRLWGAASPRCGLVLPQRCLHHSGYERHGLRRSLACAAGEGSNAPSSSATAAVEQGGSQGQAAAPSTSAAQSADDGGLSSAASPSPSPPAPAPQASAGFIGSIFKYVDTAAPGLTCHTNDQPPQPPSNERCMPVPMLLCA
jgi:hypothetical protein